MLKAIIVWPLAIAILSLLFSGIAALVDGNPWAWFTTEGICGLILSIAAIEVALFVLSDYRSRKKIPA